MDKTSSTDIAQGSQDEKNMNISVGATHDEKALGQDVKHDLVDATRRRKSVALNIIENPLKVSFAMSGP